MTAFRGDRAFLSNFHPAPVELDGVMYPTVEHAYMAAKTLNPAERAQVLMCPTPGQAKRLGRTLTLRNDWTHIRIDVMRDLIAKKFQHPALAAQLRATGDEPLVEVNNWGDRFWGVCDGTGENWLGRLLMEVRDRLQLPTPPLALERPTRWAVVGSRGFPNRPLFTSILTHILTPGDTVVSGGARGVDDWAKMHALNTPGLHYREWPADWSQGRGAGIARNTQIIADSHACLAFWDGVSRGTKDSILKAHARGLWIMVTYPTGRWKLSTGHRGIWAL
jgi:N-glycosidase YbiA